MDEWSWTRRLGYGALRCTGIGFVAGGFEACGLAYAIACPYSGIERFVISVTAVGSMGFFALLLATVVGAPLHRLGRHDRATRVMARQLGLVALLLCGYYLWPLGLALWRDTRVVGAAALSAIPIGVGGIFYYNADYWLRRTEAGRPLPPGWVALSAIFAALLTFGSVGLASVLHDDTARATDGRNVVLISVDGLRRDGVGVFGGDPTPGMDAIARDGISFGDAVTPIALSRAANATLLTGLHPIRHRLLRADEPLDPHWPTLGTAFAREGWSTVAFVSSTDVDATSGLGRGFQSYDDDVGIPLWARTDLVGRLVRASGPIRGYRTTRETMERVLDWLPSHAQRPFFVWVHLAEPAWVPADQYGASLSELDLAVAQLTESLKKQDLFEKTVIVIVGTHGVQRGEHAGASGAWDESVRIPLAIRLPKIIPAISRVDPQVRLMDVAPSLLEAVSREPWSSEGISLLGYSTGLRSQTVWTSVLGTAPDGRVQVGLRNNGVKYLQTLDRTWDGRPASGPCAPRPKEEGCGEALFDVRNDPKEASDLSQAQPAVVEQARTLLHDDLTALQVRLREQ